MLLCANPNAFAWPATWWQHKNPAEVRSLAKDYDQQRPYLSAQEVSISQKCALIHQDDGRRDPILNAQCDYLNRRRYFVSDDRRFMKLTHFQKGIWSERWQQKSHLYYEGENGQPGRVEPRQSRVYLDEDRLSSRMAFINAMERFATQPEYGCLGAKDPRNHRPALAWYLHQHFNQRPSDCLAQQEIPIVLREKDNDVQILFRAQDIQEIHLALVSPGKDFLSRWGHLMLILVPKSGEPVAINYHGNFNGHQYSEGQFTRKLIDGLSGEHLAMMMPSYLNSQLKHYVGEQKRRVESWTLVLSEVEKTQLLYQIFEDFAFYRGEWRHLSSNCVSHLVDLLKAALPDSILDGWITDVHTPEEAVQFMRQEVPWRLKNKAPIQWGL
ncbi:MAG: DUF4105 domain-containing protein [Bdellovibrionales bacterium]